MAMNRVGERAVVFLPWETIEAEAQQQILNTAKMPFVFKHVAVMPDCHYGKGATVGTVLPTHGAVIPAAVGVDIGCGMIAVRTPLKRSRDQDPAADSRRNRAPDPDERREEQRAVDGERREAGQGVGAAGRRARRRSRSVRATNWRLALGTLGGGNHFIELAEDGDGAVWVTLHSGSRGVGNESATTTSGSRRTLARTPANSAAGS